MVSSNIRTDTAEAHDLPYPDSSFDLVTCRIAAHHFADVPLFVQEAARVLRPGGILAVVDNIVPPGAVGHYVNAFEKLRDPSHGRCLTLEEWTALFASSGLTVANAETLAKRLNFDFWAQRHDRTMQAYLRALLLESNTAVATFLDPQGGWRRADLSPPRSNCNRPQSRPSILSSVSIVLWIRSSLHRKQPGKEPLPQ